MISWMDYYLTLGTQRVRVGNYLSETIYCHSGVPQGSHLDALFFIADINDVLDIVENIKVFEMQVNLVFPWVQTGVVSICHWR
jgi:hypothetical protein